MTTSVVPIPTSSAGRPRGGRASAQSALSDERWQALTRAEQQLRLDAPRARRGHAAGQLLHARGRAGHVDTTALREHAQLRRVDSRARKRPRMASAEIPLPLT